MPRRLRAAIGVVLVTGLLTATFAPAGSPEMYQNLGLLTEVLTDIKRDYVDEVDQSKLVHGAITGMLDHLRGENEIIPRGVARGARDAEVGLIVTRRNDDLTVVTSADASPARRAGLEPGDRILKIDGADTRQLDDAEAVDRLWGRSGATVALTVTRHGWMEPRTITLAYERLGGPVVSARDLGGGMLWVRVHRMTPDIGAALTRALAGSARAGLVLDLRNVGSGDASDAVDLAQRFLDAGTVVTFSAGRESRDRHELRAAASTRVDEPTVVLVNAGTARAAEIVAGALQDERRAVLIGERTFGIATAATNIPLADGSMVHLTTARYFTPKGHRIDGEGIDPDLQVASSANTTTRDAQLDRAVEVLKIESTLAKARP